MLKYVKCPLARLTVEEHTKHVILCKRTRTETSYGCRQSPGSVGGFLLPAQPLDKGVYPAAQEAGAAAEAATATRDSRPAALRYALLR